MTVDDLRRVVSRLIESGQLVNPQSLRLQQPYLVMDLDDHLSDEAIGGGRVRVVLRSVDELKLITRALEDESV